MGMLDDIETMQRQIDALPPAPWCIRASHAVPYGRAFRQWDTKGRLIVWANRGEIADMPHRKYMDIDVVVSTIAPPHAFGIPVVND